MTAPAPIQHYVGATWVFPLTVTNPDNTPVNLTSATCAATFWSSGTGASAGTSLTVGNGGVVVTDPVNGKVQIVVAPGITATVTPDPDRPCQFPNRIAFTVDGAPSSAQTIEHIILIQALSPRSTAITDVAASGATVTVV